MLKCCHLLTLALLCFGMSSAMIIDEKHEDSTDENYTIEDPENTTVEEQNHTEDDMEIDSTVKLDYVPTTDSVVEKKTQGPSIPATPKPICSSYVCPGVFPPQVSTESSSAETSSPEAVEITESEDTTSGTTLNPIVEYFGSNESNETVLLEEDKTQKPSDTINGPSISATPKPQYPSYVPGPWIYPKPVDEQHMSRDPAIYPIHEYQFNLPDLPHYSPIYPYGVGQLPPYYPLFFPVDLTTTLDEKHSGETSTRDPNCPSYVSCPWIYPVPVTDVPPVQQPSAETLEVVLSNSNNDPDTTQTADCPPNGACSEQHPMPSTDVPSIKYALNTDVQDSTNAPSPKDSTLDNDIFGVLGLDDEDDISDLMFFDSIVGKEEQLSHAREILHAMIYGNSPFVFIQKKKPSLLNI